MAYNNARKRITGSKQRENGANVNVLMVSWGIVIVETAAKIAFERLLRREQRQSLLISMSSGVERQVPTDV